MGRSRQSAASNLVRDQHRTWLMAGGCTGITVNQAILQLLACMPCRATRIVTPNLGPDF